MTAACGFPTATRFDMNGNLCNNHRRDGTGSESAAYVSCFQLKCFDLEGHLGYALTSYPRFHPSRCPAFDRPIQPPHSPLSADWTFDRTPTPERTATCTNPSSQPPPQRKKKQHESREEEEEMIPRLQGSDSSTFRFRDSRSNGRVESLRSLPANLGVVGCGVLFACINPRCRFQLEHFN